MELRALNFPGAQLRFFKGRRLHFDFSISPTIFSRLYRCKLCFTPNRAPEMFVMRPNLISLAEGRSLPHVYQHDGPGTKLCLWLPRKCEWVPQMRLIETYVSWTGEWLNYFEEWLISDAWAGGGTNGRSKRSLRAARLMPMSAFETPGA